MHQNTIIHLALPNKILKIDYNSQKGTEKGSNGGPFKSWGSFGVQNGSIYGPIKVRKGPLKIYLGSIWHKKGNKIYNFSHCSLQAIIHFRKRPPKMMISIVWSRATNDASWCIWPLWTISFIKSTDTQCVSLEFPITLGFGSKEPLLGKTFQTYH